MIDLIKCPPKFSRGRTVGSPGAIALGIDFSSYINRHVRGGWGDIDEEDLELNDSSIQNGSRILSAYDTPRGRIWIITEADRAVTTVLLPSDY